ncbi:MAG: hypothetical protein ACR2PZ_11695 [Pseudomonadales bacterium]
MTLGILVAQVLSASLAARYTLMFTAFWLNVTLPVSIRFWQRHYGGPPT